MVLSLAVFVLMVSGGFTVHLNEQIDQLLKQYSQSDNSLHNQKNRAMQIKNLCFVAVAHGLEGDPFLIDNEEHMMNLINKIFGE